MNHNSFVLVCFRLVQYTSVQDLEIYVELKEGSLQLPLEFPKRFDHRIVQQYAKNVFQIHSTPYDISTLTCTESLKSSGIWITKDDYTAKGNVNPTVFGLSLHEHIRWAFDIAYAQSQFQSDSKVYVGYHGTSFQAYKSIQKENQLKPSFGQLGNGVYVGSFWKACRFAGRNQDYELREHPVVLRVLCLGKPPKQIIFPCTQACTCTIWCSSAKTEMALACAHEKDWNTENDGSFGFLKPTQMSDGKWITKNEEYIFPSSSVLRLAEAVSLNKESIYKPHYDPWQRNIKII